MLQGGLEEKHVTITKETTETIVSPLWLKHQYVTIQGHENAAITVALTELQVF